MDIKKPLYDHNQKGYLNFHVLARSKSILLNRQSHRVTVLRGVKHCCSPQPSTKPEPSSLALALGSVSCLTPLLSSPER